MPSDSNTPESLVEIGDEKQDFEKWDYGHLILECFRCGEKKLMDRDVEGGISMYLPTTDKHELRLVCNKCNNSMRMFFTKSDKIKPPQVEPSEMPPEVIEEKRKRKKVKRNEIPKGSKAAESVPSSGESS